MPVWDKMGPCPTQAFADRSSFRPLNRNNYHLAICHWKYFDLKMKSWNLAVRPESLDHEDVFIQRYGQLFSQALKITGRDREVAEDLVQDAFIHFTLGKPDLREIQNLDGYFYTLLRNLYLSRVRRSSHTLNVQLSLLDYDSAEIGMQAVDPRAQMQARAELRAICRYACQRKQSSKAGSALILRYFHGYYPSEIAAILRGPVRAVADWLLIARREGRLYLEDPQRLGFFHGSNVPEIQNVSAEDFAQELRRMIFQLRHEQCFSAERLEELYGAEPRAAVEASVLSELVSCPRCLDAVNRRLGLPLLDERHPTDTVGSDRKSGGGSTGGGQSTPDWRRLRQRARAVAESRPQELHCAVNGFVISALTLSSERSEQVLRINLNEPIGFVEIFSEQEVCLLYREVTPLPEGEPNQCASVALSDGRVLSIDLSFDHAWPSLAVRYRDPQFNEAPVTNNEPEIETTEITDAGLSRRRRFLEWFRLPGFRLRAGMAMILIGLMMVAALLFVKTRVRPVSAAELLRRAEAAEARIASNPELATHRTWRLEERDANGKLLSSRRIEVWQSSAQQVTARRLYDESGELIAGEWRGAGRARTLYRWPEAPGPLAADLNFASVWLREAAAGDFSALIENTAAGIVEQDTVDYVIRYERAADAGLIKASLVIRRADLRVRAQTLIIRQGNAIREYRFSEENFEQRPIKSLPPSIFTPEPDLTPRIGSNETAQPRISDPQPGDAATAELEIEILQRLNQAGALLGEQISLQRTPGGSLLVQGIVETAERKQELRQALAPYSRSPAVKIEVYTIAEAQRRKRSFSRSLSSRGSSDPGAMQEVEIRQEAMPVEAELRSRFAGRGWDEPQMQREIQQFANRIFERSTRLRGHALALKQIAGRFSPVELQTLPAAARAQWRVIIMEQAQAFRRETESLRRELEPLFPVESSVPPESENDAGIAGADEPARLANRLFDLARSNDEAIRRSFSLSAEKTLVAPVKTASFWRSLRSAENLAARLAAPQN